MEHAHTLDFVRNWCAFFFCLNSDTLIISILSYLHVKIPVRSVSGFGIKVIAFLIWECFTEVKHLN